ncbi:type II secretion system F family protein [Streptacidiphilus monticola]|uniref:Type II secretion system F family protein n=1 Tax=Streptacidiphilus monticola TaxID=2161674 RepID=A0ABW1G296_9ACTN
MTWQMVQAAGTGLALCLIGWGAWRYSRRETVQRRRRALGPGGSGGREGEGLGPDEDVPFGRLARAWAVRVRTGPLLRHPELALVPVGLASAVATWSVVPMLLGAGSVVPLIRLRRRRADERARQARQAAVTELCVALSAELRAGATPHQAVEMAVVEPSVLDRSGLLAAARFGGSVPDAFRALAREPGAEGAHAVAACWELAAAGGAGLAGAVDRVAEALRGEQELAASVAAELAGARSTAWLLAGLPLFGLTLGGALGARPLDVLLHTPAGLGCLAFGLLLETAGLWWTERLARSARAAC